MAKIKKPAPKGGKKAAAPKKVAKRVKQALPPIVPTTDAALKRLGVKPSLTARQIDQFNADKMRADAFNAAQASKPLTIGEAMAAFEKPLHPTVEEQYLGGVMSEMRDLGAGIAERAGYTVPGPTSTKPPSLLRRAINRVKRAFRFRSAKSGEYVTPEYAAANPDTTVRERAD